MPVNFTGSYNQTFDALALAGTNTAWTNDTTLAGWSLFSQPAGTAITTYSSSDGSSNAGTFNSYGTVNSSDRALGGLGSGGAYFGSPVAGNIAGWIAFSATNGTGAAINQLNLSFNGEEWRNGGNTTAQTMVLEYGFGTAFTAVTTWVAPGGTFNWNSPVATATAGAIDGNTIGRINNVGGSLSSLNWANGDTLWIRWVERNDVGNDHGLAIDDFALSAPTVSLPAVSIAATANAAETGPANGSFRVSRTGATTNPLIVNYAVNTAGIGQATPSSDYTALSGTVTIAAGSSFADIIVFPVDDTLVEGNEDVTLTLAALSSYTIGTATAKITIVDNDLPAPTITKIHDIQGSGTTFNSAFGGTQTIEGIVVSAFLGATQLNGFYVEEENADWDANSATSEGIFVFDPTGLFAGQVGNKVQVTGLVGEYTSSATNIANQAGNSSLTQLSLASTVATKSVVNLGTSILPGVINITLPIADASVLEQYEGMLVNISAATGPLTVTDTFGLGRYGQVGLSSDGRLDQFTQVNAPSVTGYANYLANLFDRYIIVDDGSSTQNPDPEIFARGGQPLSASNPLRAGDTVASVTGVLDQRYEGYRIQTRTPVDFQATNPRPTTAPDVGGGALRVASANLLNYFTDLDTNAVITINNGVSFEPRGANTAAELQRQQDKAVAALLALNADIIGIQEMENDGTKSLQTLVNALNAVAGAGTYAFVLDTNLINDPNPAINAVGTDAIKVGILYKPGKVTPVGTALSYLEPNAASPIFSRPPIAQTFVDSKGEKFTVIMNHFKSKSATGATGADIDQNDGQGAYNAKRVAQANALLSFINTVKTTSGDDDVMVIGDLNAYAKEDPIATLTNGGLVNLFTPSSYSYQFDGQWGALDYGLVTSSLAAQITGSAKFHNNSDEPVGLDYNTEFKSANQINSFYASTPYRASDHDPLVIGLSLNSPFKIVNGTAGRDTLVGTAGKERITGGFGADILTGGAGNDEFVYTSIRDAGDTITDFTVGQDKLVLTQLFTSLNLNLTYASALAGGYLKFDVQGSNAVISIDVDGSVGSGRALPFITLQNVTTAALLNADNFII